jgi:hypothetical protein
LARSLNPLLPGDNNRSANCRPKNYNWNGKSAPLLDFPKINVKGGVNSGSAFFSVRTGVFANYSECNYLALKCAREYLPEFTVKECKLKWKWIVCLRKVHSKKGDNWLQ